MVLLTIFQADNIVSLIFFVLTLCSVLFGDYSFAPALPSYSIRVLSTEKQIVQKFLIRLVARIIDGKIVSANVKSRVMTAVRELNARGVQPCLATILVGDDPASAAYIESKHKDANEVGIITRDHRLAASFKHKELLELIELLNNDREVHGILVQLPLPSHINEFDILTSLSPLKDVDGLTPYNVGLMQSGIAALRPCTPSGIMELLDYYKINVTGMDVVIVNRSNLVGKPLLILLLERDATVTVCHSKTKHLSEKLRKADLIVTAVGNRQHFTLTANMVKKDVVVIDVGIARINGRLTGDLDFDSVKQKASWVTPVPGGVGLMTRAMLLKNTVTAADLITQER